MSPHSFTFSRLRYHGIPLLWVISLAYRLLFLFWSVALLWIRERICCLTEESQKHFLSRFDQLSWLLPFIFDSSTMAVSRLPVAPIFCSRSFLLGIIVVQWILLTFLLLSQLTHQRAQDATAANPHPGPQGGVVASSVVPCIAQSPPARVPTNRVSIPKYGSFDEDLNSEETTTNALPGVGVTVLFRSPQWFHLRTTHMLHNAVINLPPGWGLQIFINPSWFYSDAKVLHWHPGLRRLLGNHVDSNQTTTTTTTTDKMASGSTTQFRGRFLGRPIYVTWLPESLTKRPTKPKGVMHSTWFWREIQAERILIFSGNGVFCGNHVLFDHDTTDEDRRRATNTIWDVWDWTLSTPSSNYLDYMGSPWRHYGGQGGDGSSHSYRNRTSMIRLLEYAGGDDDQSWQTSTEHLWVLQTMKRYNDEHSDGKFRIATPDQTLAFGGVQQISSDNKVLNRVPYVAAGTFANLAWDERETLLKHCPEIKTIFPSLHEPSCFGAHPKPDTCRQSICALQENLPSSGC